MSKPLERAHDLRDTGPRSRKRLLDWDTPSLKTLIDLLRGDGLESGPHPRHKFTNSEMPMLGGLEAIHLAGVNATRRLAVYGLEVLRSSSSVSMSRSSSANVL